MFVGNNLIFLELQKTGGSHILRLLEKWVEGEIVGKHNRLLNQQTDKCIIGSIRNPWDWYVSLWAYGVSGKGAIRNRTHRKFDLEYYSRLLPKSMGKNFLSPAELLTAIYHDLLKPVSLWRSCYQDSSDPEQFRRWLSLLLNQKHCYDIGEGFGFSPVSSHAGLMTYRYLRQFTLGNAVYCDKGLSTANGVVNFDSNNNITGAMIRTECLEEDFVAALNTAGVKLATETVDQIRASGKTNTSSRNKASFYYDSETIDLVSEKEQFIIQKYAYTPPVLAHID